MKNSINFNSDRPQQTNKQTNGQKIGQFFPVPSNNQIIMIINSMEKNLNKI